jgi:hypothetical protein
MAAKEPPFKLPRMVVVKLKKTSAEMRAARKRINKSKRESDRLGRETDKTLARIERRLSA